MIRLCFMQKKAQKYLEIILQSQASCHWTIPQLCSSETLTYDKGGFRYCQGGITPIKSFALF